MLARKLLKYLIIGCCLSFFVNTPAAAETHIVLDSITNLVCDQYDPYWSQHTVIISLANPDEIVKHFWVGFDIEYTDKMYFLEPSIEFYNGFDTLGPSWLPLLMKIDTLPNGLRFSVAFDTIVPEQYIQGIPVHSDTIQYIGLSFWFIHGGGSEPQVICVDSSTQTAFGTWGIPGQDPPTWSGQECHLAINRPDCCFTGIMNCPRDGLAAASICDPISYWLDVVGELCMIEVTEGPGRIDTGYSIYEYTYTYTPILEDAGKIIPVKITAYEDICGDGSACIDLSCWFYLTVGDSAALIDDPVEFTHPQQQKFVAVTDEPLEVTLAVEDDGPCTDYNYSYFIWPEDLIPPGSIDTVTGTFTYLGTTADTGTYWVCVVVEERDVLDTMGFYIYHYEDYVCGNADHQGTVDIGDLTHLIGYLFQSGVSPIPMEAGDVDCVEGIDIGDLTCLIDFLFISFDPLCDGC